MAVLFTRFLRPFTVLATLLIALAALPGAAPPTPPALAATPAQAAPPDAGAGVLTIAPGRAPKIDGSCDDFSDVTPQSFADVGGGAGQVFLKNNSGNLYVCIQAKPGTFKSRFGSVYLDPQGDGAGYEFAQKDDFALHVPLPGGANETFNGSGIANGYVTNAAQAGFWEGSSAASPNGESFEYRIGYGRFLIKDCQVFGIAAYHHWVRDVGDDYGWPSNKYFDQPRTWQPALIDNGQCQGTAGKIAYVYRGNGADATSFYNLLTARSYSVDLIPLANVLATDFSAYQLIIIADDTGSLNDWGSSGLTADQVSKITLPNKPIIGLGEGGYAFFGKLSLFIGWPNGWHGPASVAKQPTPPPPTTHYSSPNIVTPAADGSVKLYTQPVNEVGIFLGAKNSLVPSDTLVIAEEPYSAAGAPSDHASIIQQSCRQLWGFSGNPNLMTLDGKNLFINAVAYGSSFQCSTPPPPPVECTIKKSASPPSGTTVAPGDTILYTIEYVNCKAERVKLIDTIPLGTIFVPGSASDGIAPAADGVLTWLIGASESGSKSFKVRVTDTPCVGNKTISNRAALLISGASPIVSNVVTHPVKCPPIGLPNDQPPYAEREVQINPYPLVTGTPSTIKVRLVNTSAVSQVVKVSFQTSPQRFGIGINFASFDQQTVVIPAGGNIIVSSVFTPVSSGHYCIQIKIEDASPQPKYAPIFTQRNLDVTEDLTPGKPDDLVFKVANPLSVTANISLTVDNTCPGWTATVSPAVLTAVGANGADVRDATLRVTPPVSGTLGSGCHIDVQGWIGDQLIGGIRKLDVPPVHLPFDVNPSWLEPEISFDPNPPIAGKAGKICVEVQNPLPVAKTITLEYAVADFGAGIPFTTVATKTVTLPPNSLAKYCVDWTPSTSGTLHRCVQITLKQPGYRDLRSQHNVDIRRVKIRDLATLQVPVVVGNPDIVSHTLTISPTFYGIDPLWKLHYLGDPPPPVLGPGGTTQILIGLLRSAEVAQASGAATFFGDESRIDVAVLLDGKEVGGFTINVEQDTPKLYLPIVLRN